MQEFNMAGDHTDVNFSGIVAAIEAMSHGFRRLETVVDKMADSVNRLAVMEERQLSDRRATERAFTEIAELKKELAGALALIHSAESKLLVYGRTSVWVERAVWAAACAGTLAVASGKIVI